jgi:hypothetical protein
MLKKISVIFVFAVMLYLVLPSNISAQPFGYEGTQVCGMCHKTEKQGQQLKIWQDSKHSHAYKTLQTPEADKIAADKGLKTKAIESKECLKCHASGDGVDKALIGAKFKMEDGVQCETCHGPGSAYKAMSVMKNKADAKTKGLADLDDVKVLCAKCHNTGSPTHKEFKFDEMWVKIAHKVPKG